MKYIYIYVFLITLKLLWTERHQFWEGNNRTELAMTFTANCSCSEGYDKSQTQTIENPHNDDLIAFRLSVLSCFIIWLVVYLPLWKIWKSVGIIIPNIWKIKNVPNHQPVMIYFWARLGNLSTWLVVTWHSWSSSGKKCKRSEQPTRQGEAPCTYVLGL